jgi:hypothetical protein
MTFMRPGRLPHLTFRIIGKVSALLGRPGPLHWLTITGRESGNLRSVTVALYEVDARTYVIDLVPFRGWAIDTHPFRGRDRKLPLRGWAIDVRTSGRGTLTTGRTDTEVTLTEVTDPAVKRQVLTLVEEDIPEGLAAAVSRTDVFEVTPA